MTAVGKDIARLDGIAKVTGTAFYVDDISLPGMWHGAVVRATIPHGRAKKIEFDPVFDWSKVVVATHEDIPGKNCVQMIEADVPLIAHDKIMHVGEALLLIAAPTRELALAARENVKIEYEELEPVFSINDAKKAKVKIRGKDNIISQYTVKKGDIEKGFKSADVVLEGRYTMGHQEHMYIEPQGIIASFEGDYLKVVGSIQCPYYVSSALSVSMGMLQEKISVRQATIGGAFGGKEDYPSILAGYASVLSKKSGHPVKIVYERDEDTRVTTKRHPADVLIRIGAKKDGTLVAMDILFELDAGAYTTMSPVVLSRGVLHSPGPYRCENVLAHAFAYATNTPPNGAYRGFGAPQAFFPLEVQIDCMADALGMSPVEFRQKNCFEVGDTTATGQILKESVATSKVLKDATRRSNFEKKHKQFLAHKSGHIRRGIGLSLFMHGAGFTGSGEAYLKGKAGLRLDADGKITVLTACTEMGQGAHTVLPQMTADHLNLNLSCIGIETPDTAIVPNSGPTVASRTTMIMGVVLGKCVKLLKEKLFPFAAEKFNVQAQSLVFQGDSLVSCETPLLCKEGKGEVDQVSTPSNSPLQRGRTIYPPLTKGRKLILAQELVKMYLKEVGPLTVIDHYELPPGISWDDKEYKGDAYPAYAWGCDVAEVEVDMQTFEVRVVKMWMAVDVGKAINPKMVAGQIEGGTLQALGYCLMERHVMDKGHFKTGRFQTYIIPTTKDAPEFETIIVEEPFSFGPMGAKGLGELPMDGGAPAIVNAIRNATGLEMNSLPVTPEKLYEEWKKVQKPSILNIL